MVTKNGRKMLVGVSGKAQSGKDEFGKIYQYIMAHYSAGYSWKPNEEDYKSWLKNGHQKHSHIEIKKFADKLKDMVCLLLGCTREQLEDPKFKESTLGEEWVKYELSYVSHDRLSYCSCSKYYKKYFCSKEEAIEYIEGDLEVDQDSIEISKIELTPRLLLQLLGTACGRDIIHPNIWINSTISNLTDNSNWIISDVRFPNEAKVIKDKGGILIRINRNIGLEFMHESETALDNYNDWDYTIDNDGTIENLIEKVKQILITEGLLNETNKDRSF